jgi:hypothetical protein
MAKPAATETDGDDADADSRYVASSVASALDH